ncbi:hypothetical protein PANI_CDS0106 [Maribacter phage Panino]
MNRENQLCRKTTSPSVFESFCGLLYPKTYNLG